MRSRVERGIANVHVMVVSIQGFEAGVLVEHGEAGSREALLMVRLPFVQTVIE